MAASKAKSKRPRLAINHDDKQSDNDEKPSADTLNDKCWLKIINLLYTDDLCNVVQVNRQLKRISLKSFTERFTTFHYDPVYNEDLHLQVLRKFGYLVKSMKVRDRAFTALDINGIAKYCGGTLEEVNLDINFPFNGDLVKPLFASLKALQIFWNYFDEMIKECKCLKVLIIIMLTDPHKSGFEQNIPTLEELNVVDILGHDQTVKTLLQLNPQIKKLSMFRCNANKTLCLVAPNMAKLVELKIRVIEYDPDNYENISELSKLKSLKVLELQDVREELVLAIIEAMQNVALERFKWIGRHSNMEFMNNIQNLKTLKSVALTIHSRRMNSIPIGEIHLKMKEKLPFLEAFELEIIDEHKYFLRNLIPNETIFDF